MEKRRIILGVATALVALVVIVVKQLAGAGTPTESSGVWARDVLLPRTGTDRADSDHAGSEWRKELTAVSATGSSREVCVQPVGVSESPPPPSANVALGDEWTVHFTLEALGASAVADYTGRDAADSAGAASGAAPQGSASPGRRLSIRVGRSNALSFSGRARRIGKHGSMDYGLTIPERFLNFPQVQLDVASSLKALDAAGGAPVRLGRLSRKYTFGSAGLRQGKWDYARRTISGLVIPFGGLRPIGTLTLKPALVPLQTVSVWRSVGRTKMETIVPSFPGGRAVPFGASEVEGSWSADLVTEAHLRHANRVVYGPVGTDLVLVPEPRNLRSNAGFQISVDLSTLQDAGSVFIRPSDTDAPSLLSEQDLGRRIASIGIGSSTLSDRLARGPGQPPVPLGSTKLAYGDYAVEVWSRPDRSGMARLLRTSYERAEFEMRKVVMD